MSIIHISPLLAANAMAFPLKLNDIAVATTSHENNSDTSFVKSLSLLIYKEQSVLF